MIYHYMEFSNIKELLFDIKMNTNEYFAEIYSIDKKNIPISHYDYLHSLNMPAVTPIIKTDISDYFTHFQNSGLHAIVESVIAESRKLNNNSITGAVDILEQNYVVW